MKRENMLFVEFTHDPINRLPQLQAIGFSAENCVNILMN